MPEERIINSVQSVAEFKIKMNGEALPRTVEILGVHVSKIINKISMARLVVMDGSTSDSDFPLSNGELFVPGNEVEITAGTPDSQLTIFNGLVTKQSLSIRNARAPQLVVECKHKSVKATIVKRSKCYHDSTDDAAITEALQASGLAGGDLDMEATVITHKELVQYNCTDWDFAVMRAETNGKMVLTNDEKVVMKKPDFTAAAALSLLFGATILELDAEMDSRSQYKTVKAKAWDMAGQAIAESEAAEPVVSQQGDIDGSTLSDVTAQEEYLLQHSGSLPEDELKLWADAQLLKSRLAKIRGRVKFEGIATVNAGDMLDLNGIGNRFNGTAFVSGVRHDYNLSEGWKTQAQFGNTPDWFADTMPVNTTKAGGLLAGTVGLHIGVVTDNEDPAGEFRVRVRFPYIQADDDGVWARISLTDAGDARGMFFRPEVGDEVVAGFLYDDPRQPVILGMLHSSAKASPLSPSNDNHKKGYTSREKMVLLFDDEKKEITIETPGGNKVKISDDAKGISMQDMNGNKLEMNDQGITISSPMKIEITAGTDLKLAAANLSAAANAGLSLSGSGSSKIESSGTLELKGTLVKIN